MQIGLNLTLRAINASARFSPASLFAAGEQGAWYDPSDFSTMFQDSAGTTPVTAVEQPVGLMLDKSKGLVLGPELSAYASGFSSTTGVTGIGATVALSGASLVTTATSTDGADRAEIPISGLTTGQRYLVTLVARRGAQGTNQSIRASTAFNFPNSFPASTSNQTFTFRVDAIAASGVIRVYAADATGAVGDSIIVDSISVRELPGNHATQSTAASRPVLRQEANGAYYLAFDGVDDGMVTNSIDFTATDKMTVVAGVRKLSDAARGVLAELSASTAGNAGSFVLTAPEGATSNYGFGSRGSILNSPVAASPFAAPITNVLTGIGDISGDSAILRVNGTQAAISTADQGTGNYGNYPLYIGRRGGTTLPFNGRLYGLIVRGAASTAQQITQAESWMNSKTRAF